MPLPASVNFYDAEIAASLDDLLANVAEREELCELVERIKFLVKKRTEHLEEWLAQSGEQGHGR